MQRKQNKIAPGVGGDTKASASTSASTDLSTSAGLASSVRSGSEDRSSGSRDSDPDFEAASDGGATGMSPVDGGASVA